MKRALNGLPESLLKRLQTLEPEAFAEVDRRLRPLTTSLAAEESLQAFLVSKWIDVVDDPIGDEARSREFRALRRSRDRRSDGRGNDGARLDGFPSASPSPLANAMTQEDLARLRARVLTLPQRQRDALECGFAIDGTGPSPTGDEESEPSRREKWAEAAARRRARKSASARLKFD